MIDCAHQIHLLALHDRPGYEYAVPGLGLLCDTSTIFVGAGVYQNSVNRASTYAMAGRYLWRSQSLKLGFMAGAVDGYRIDGGFVPLAGLVASAPLWRGAVGHVAALPGVNSGTLQSPATLQFSVTFGAWK